PQCFIGPHQFKPLILVSINIMTILTIVALLAIGAAAEEKAPVPDFVVEGTCPTVDEKTLWEQQKPNHAKFAGTWFEVGRTDNPYQLVKECTHSNLTYNGNGFQHITMGLGADGNLLRRDGLTFPFITGANANSPHLSIQFEMPSWAAPFVILDTDYDSYACIYSCMDFNNQFVADFGFVWSRIPDMHIMNFEKCRTAFTKIALNTERIQIIKQGDDCKYDTIQSSLSLKSPKMEL
ncbi:unnamed protein product, partial [Meganyctiphanes norvegica]